MKNETQASIQQIYKAFRKLTQHVLNTYRKPPVTLTNNLYNGLQQAIKNREEKKYFGPDELWKPREKQGQLGSTEEPPRDIYKTISILRSKMTNYYKSGDKGSNVTFDIETLHGRKKYRLTFLFNNEHIDAFIRRIREEENSAKRLGATYHAIPRDPARLLEAAGKGFPPPRHKTYRHNASRPNKD